MSIKNYLFHRVNPKRDLLWDPMDVALFERCIKHISQNYSVVLFEDLLLNQSWHSVSNLATIMFDDGYKDNIEYAAPILKKYNCRASFYVVTNCIDRNIPTWTHILEYQFQNTNNARLEMLFDFLPNDLKIDGIPDKRSRLKYVAKLKPFLKKLTHSQRQLVLDKVSESYNDVAIPDLMMDWEDLKLLRSEGHYIGSHTLSHCLLGTMEDEQEVQEELLNSGKTIEKHLGYFPHTISYPVGSFNENTKLLAKQAGYSAGLAVKQKIFNPGIDDIFEVPRIELYNESWFKTKMRISHSLESIKSLIGYR